MTIPYLMNCAHSGEGWCLDCMRTLTRELEELRAIVSKLHKTKDGEYVLPETTVFHIIEDYGGDFLQTYYHYLLKEGKLYAYDLDDVDLIPVEECYLSEEKALEELAKLKKGTQNV